MVTIAQVEAAEEPAMSFGGCAEVRLCSSGMAGAIERLNG